MLMGQPFPVLIGGSTQSSASSLLTGADFAEGTSVGETLTAVALGFGALSFGAGEEERTELAEADAAWVFAPGG